jgi:phosphatidylserine/phosphatidylglycerophosphate/cardiolipin synthase-like enzyme
MHAKALVIDEKEAFIIGSPFRQDFWDSSAHIIHDPRRGSKGAQPKHDVSVCLRGGAVACVTEYFAQLWNYCADANSHSGSEITPATPPNAAGAQTIQIVRSVTPKTLTKKGETGILEAYRRAIANAKDFIYLENQYFTNRSVADALRNALADRPELQLILLLNENPDVPSYRQRQNDNLKRLGLDLRGPTFDHPQIGVFTLWSRGVGAEKLRLQRCYIHSKVGVVDDVWATIGSANLDGPSLNAAEEFRLLVNPKKHRSMELNAVLLDIDDAAREQVKRFRSSLWSEHLEVSTDMLFGPRPAGGWLAVWKKIASDAVTSLKGSDPTMNGRILPYSAEGNVKRQLVTLGIPMGKLDVVPEPLLPPLGQKV